MSQRLWENPLYDDAVFKKLLAKLDKCIRQERYKEAQTVSVEIIRECEGAHLALKAARSLKQESP